MIRVFGDLRIDGRDGPVEVPRGQVTVLLRLLLVRPNETISAAELVAHIWPHVGRDDAGAATQRLYMLVSRLRRYVEGLTPAGATTATLAVRAAAGGYQLVAGPDDLDRLAFESAIENAGGGHSPATSQDPLEWWTGEPYADFEDTAAVRTARGYLRERRHTFEITRRRSPSGASGLDMARTRIMPPMAVSVALVGRDDLVDRIGRVGTHPIVGLVAPAGYGKTLLLAQWVAAQSCPVAWLSLEAADDDVVRAWSAIEQSVRHAGAVMRLDSAASPGSPGHVAAIGRSVERAIADHGAFGLVLDDVQHVTNPAVLAPLHRLAQNTAGLTIVVSGRAPFTSTAPDADAVPTLGAGDLRFTGREIEELRSRTGLDREVDLEGLTDGWPILVGHLCRSGHRTSRLDPERVALDMYIVGEVLDELPADVRRFVLETSALDWLNAELCDAATGRTDSALHLEWLRARDLLVVEIPARSRWQRCQPLIRALLEVLAEGDPTIDSRAVRRRAGRWYAAARMPERALEYAISADDDEVVAELAGEVVDRAIAAPRLDTCQRWLRAIDPAVVATDRATHDFLTMAADFWLGADERARWERSDRRHFGDDTLISLAIASGDSYRDGRARASVVLAERTLARMHDYFDRHPSLPTFRKRFARHQQMRLLCGRLLAGELDADSPQLHALATEARSAIPAMSLWLFGEWAFLALIEGRDELAAELVGGVSDQLSAVDPGNAHLTAGRLLVAKALVQSAATDDTTLQRALSDRLHVVVDRYRELRRPTELVPALLALHVTESRAGRLAAAGAARDEADLLLTMFEDAPLLHRARAVLGPDSIGRATARRGARIAPGVFGLTEREQAVLALLVDGLSYRQVADRLGLSHHTVSGYASAAYRKLGVRTRQGAARLMRA